MDYILSVILYPLPFLAVLTVLVFVHEFGHFWVARRCGVKIDTFSIGFGSELFGWNDRHGTRWKFSILPLGGYVKMFGDDDATSWTETPDTSHMTESDRKQLFANKTIAQRAAVVFAGPLFNFLFTIVVFFGLFATLGERFDPPVASEVLPGTPAAEAGVRAGDTFLSIDSQPIVQFEDIAEVVSKHAGDPLSVRVRNGDVERTLTITPRMVEDTSAGKTTKDVRIGIKASEPQYIRQSVGQSLGKAFVDTYRVTADTLKTIWQILDGTRSSSQLGGVIAIGKISHDSAQNGAANLIYVAAVLSVNLGLLNLFPIPVLDGGHLLFYGVEAIKGSPPREAVMKYSFRFGLALVLMLAVFANWNDVVRFDLLGFMHTSHPS